VGIEGLLGAWLEVLGEFDALLVTAGRLLIVAALNTVEVPVVKHGVAERLSARVDVLLLTLDKRLASVGFAAEAPFFRKRRNSLRFGNKGAEGTAVVLP